jgi:hypothetical protein
MSALVKGKPDAGRDRLISLQFERFTPENRQRREFLPEPLGNSYQR